LKTEGKDLLWLHAEEKLCGLLILIPLDLAQRDYCYFFTWGKIW